MYKILLVEDSPTQLAHIRMILEESGLAVTTAGNGLEALEAIKADEPNAVVTDLQMPEMNGLELISALRKKHPLIPTVLITQHGSERLAVDALGEGAASYVPKAHLQILLTEVASLVARLSAANREALPLKGTMEPPEQLVFTVDGRIARIEPLLCLIMRMLTAMDILHTLDRIRMCVALEYLLFQAVYHGSLEQPIGSEPLSRSEATSIVEENSKDPSFRQRVGQLVTCEMQCDDSELRFWITHEGGQSMVSGTALPGTPESFEDQQGRGMLLLTSVMDRVVFDRTGLSATLSKSL